MAQLVRAQMYVASAPGTAAATLQIAAPTMQTWANAGAQDGGLYSYLIEEGSTWEVGIGTYAASGPTLTRTVVLMSSNSNAAVNFGAGAIVSQIALAQDFGIGLAPLIVSGTSTYGLSVVDAGRDVFATGAPTLAVPNGYPTYCTGKITNSNLVAGLLTVTVPSGATLDGALNGTTVLYPFQKARIVQTGATAYVTDWIDRTPIVATRVLASAVASFDVALPVGYSALEITITGFIDTADFAFARLSFDGGVTVKAGAGDYKGAEGQFVSGGVNTYSLDNYSYIPLFDSYSNTSSPLMSTILLVPGSATTVSTIKVSTRGYIGGTYRLVEYGLYMGTVYGRANLFRVISNSGNVSAASVQIRGLVP